MINEVRESANCGPMLVTADLGMDKEYHRLVRVLFLYTKYTAVVRYDHFIDGYVKDPVYLSIFKTFFYILPYGPLKILRFVGFNELNEALVEIQFINSGNIMTTTYNNVLHSNVIDPLYKPIDYGNTYNYNGKVDLNKIYTSNSSGTFKILSVLENGKCAIKFTATGYEKVVQLKDALLSAVNDDTQLMKIPINHDLIIDYDRWVLRRLKTTWTALKSRCLNPTVYRYDDYGGAGVKIADEWLDFDTFYNDCKSIPQFEKYYNNPLDYQIDKDYLQMSIPKQNRIYSKSTCMFLHYFDNENIRAIEYARDNADKLASKYFGVYPATDKTYRVQFKCRNKQISIGTFSNEIAAASAFNYWHRYYHAYELVPLFNDIDEMPPEEFVKYNTNLKRMYYLL